MESNYIAVDIETTGLSPVKDKIIEIGALRVENGKVVEQFSELIDPEITLSERIIELTGITDEMLFGKPKISEVIGRFLQFAGELPLLGHNILFDYSFLKTAAIREGSSFERSGIDTLMIARILHEDLPSKTLSNMCSYYGIVNENAHRAYDDAAAAMALYEKMHEAKTGSGASLELFAAKPLAYRPKKIEPITAKQKNYLLDLSKYHKIELRQSIDKMTKSEASRLIDGIILQYGRMK